MSLEILDESSDSPANSKTNPAQSTTTWHQRDFFNGLLGGVHSVIVCYVEDVDAHCERARAAGAEIVNEPADQFYGDRTYTARDPEGHE